MKLTKRMPEAKTLLSAMASVAASAMLIRTISNEFIPAELNGYFSSTVNNIRRKFSSQLTIVIEEFKGFSPNQVFEAVNAYLGTKMTPSVQRIQVSKSEEEKELTVTIDRDEEIVDVFEGIQVKWILVCNVNEPSVSRHQGDFSSTIQTETKWYELTFHKSQKQKILNSYLPFILQKSKAIKDESKVIKLHTADYESWNSNPINLDHPMNFKTLAIDSDLKKEILDDLNNFVGAKDFYKRVGKAWKRGYLLYGPPGTGKSSLIAAMANHLNYDIYDLDLSSIDYNSQLRSLLLSMSNRSILVVEDIDCSIKFENRESPKDESANNNQDRNQVTLSGLLNFIDGIWSCCGHERIIVFTTNHKEKLDPALLRPGRMDMHIHLSYCSFSVFKQLAFNYHGICDHKLFEEIEGLIGEVKVTPAEVAGELMKNVDSQVSLLGLVRFLQKKKIEQSKAEIEEKKEIKAEENEVQKENKEVE